MSRHISFGVSLVLVGLGASLLWLVWLSYSDIAVEHQKIVALKEKWNLAARGDYKDWPKDVPLLFSYRVTTLFGLWDFYSDLHIDFIGFSWLFVDETTFIHLGLPLGVLFIALGIVVNPYVPIWKEVDEDNVEDDEVSEK